MVTGRWWFIAVLFCVHFAIALCMMVGYRTRLSTLLTWFFVTSIQDRNIILGHGGDVLHRLVLMYGITLPLGDYYSVDRLLNRSHKKRTVKLRDTEYNMFDFWTTALVFQIVSMYVIANHDKSDPAWTTTGTAGWLALQIDFFRRPFGDLLLNFPTFLKISTLAVWNWQGWGPYFFLIPFANGPFRTFGVFGSFMMHLMFGVSFASVSSPG
eukprot:TRINITY_DN410_c0_g1_i6.p1 TRINITY_DN410_c0_g1~~TRINITY_DN410_c0_g1_i6.p1  ORF type:complete len:211 (-),score=22.41 TRINITY_DN410_c0_g1_i6:133-765(-)